MRREGKRMQVKDMELGRRADRIKIKTGGGERTLFGTLGQVKSSKKNSNVVWYNFFFFLFVFTFVGKKTYIEY
jgi:hypothetical protein